MGRQTNTTANRRNKLDEGPNTANSVTSREIRQRLREKNLKGNINKNHYARNVK